jgi:hypothetical protein
MKEFTFIAGCSDGKGDSGDSYVDVKLTDEEAELLIKYGTQANIYYEGFNKCKELKDIYEKIYSIAIDQMTEEVKDYADWLSEEKRNDDNWKIDDDYPCKVLFPFEFEDMLIE